MTSRQTAIVTFAALLASIYGANWALETYGLVPVGFGLVAPAGVYFAGLTFGLRDVLHESGGRRWVLAAIVIGAALSYLVAPTFALASGAAFLFAETADYAVYAPLRDRHWTWAVIASNAAGTIIDSALFLWIAFGSLDHMTGQIVAKTYMTVPALGLVWMVRRALPRYRLEP